MKACAMCCSRQLFLDMQDLMQHDGPETQNQMQAMSSASVAASASDYSASGPSSGASTDTVLDATAFTDLEMDTVPSKS